MAMNPCPSCGAEIARDKINIAEGVGLCDACGKLSRLAEIADASELPPLSDQEVSIEDAPAGCLVEDRGDRIIVRATARSLGSAIGAGVFATFWNGIVSVFVLIAIAGLYTNISGRPLPAWFPAPGGSGSGGGSGNLGPNMPLGMTLFLCVFLIPFVLVGATMIGYLLMSLFGRFEVRLRGDDGVVLTAVGPFGFKRRFDASKVQRITLGRTHWQVNDRSKPLICIEAEHAIRFGSSLREDRMRWMHAVLHRLLVLPATQEKRILGARR